MKILTILNHPIICDKFKKDALEFLEMHDSKNYEKFRIMCSNFWEDFGLTFQEELIKESYYVSPGRVMVGMHPVSEFQYMVMVLYASSFLFHKNETIEFHLIFLREVFRRTLFDDKPKKFANFVKLVNKIVKTPMIELSWVPNIQTK